MTADRSPVLRVRTGHVAWVAERLSARDGACRLCTSGDADGLLCVVLGGCWVLTVQ